MDWFERLTGFRETGYDATRAQLQVDGTTLRSRLNGRAWAIGRLELTSLTRLRNRAEEFSPSRRSLPPSASGQVRILQGNVRELHQQPSLSGALFQVASQFNLLEMVGPDVTPEQGVTHYASDATQGPACAIAAGAATVYRNYFATVGEQQGQTAAHQIDGFADLNAALAHAMGRPAGSLCRMRNGYAMFNGDDLAAVSRHLRSLQEPALDALRQSLRIGLHWDVEVTDEGADPGSLVSQAFCSAMPVAYHHGSARDAGLWVPLATLVLEAAYEATLWAAVINARRGASRTVLLTALGGGAFGNDEAWIRSAMQRAINTVSGKGLDIVVVSYGAPSSELRRWVQTLA